MSILIKIEIYEHKGVIKIIERLQEMGTKGQRKIKCGNYIQYATSNSIHVLKSNNSIFLREKYYYKHIQSYLILILP